MNFFIKQSLERENMRKKSFGITILKKKKGKITPLLTQQQIFATSFLIHNDSETFFPNNHFFYNQKVFCNWSTSE